jgi:alpha-glucosidase
VTVSLDPFGLTIADGSGAPLLEALSGGADDAYGAVATTVDTPTFSAQLLEGWDGYVAGEGPWRHATRATVTTRTSASVVLALSGDDGLTMSMVVSLIGPRVRISLDAPPNKTTMSFRSTDDEHFFGMGERFGTVDHRGWSLYSWAEEGALGQGEGAPVSDSNPYPHGPSMTYFPVPFFLSSHGYGVHLGTTYRTEVHFASERDDAWRFAVNASKWDATIYVHHDPLATLDDYTADTGRPMVPAPWVFGARRRVGDTSMVDGVPEWQAMRQAHVPITGMDDAVHFLPALSQTGREAELQQWTATAHAEGYKVMAYNNPYVAANDDKAAADYAYGVAHGFFVKNPDGTPVVVEFISGTMLQVSPIDLTNPDAVAWFQSMLSRTLDLGYDGWMHDFGEYTPRDAVFFDGRRGDEMHDEYPVLSAKAAHDLLVVRKPDDFLFFVRSGYSGTQAFVPAVWGGDSEATFDTTLGIPSAVRAGVNLSMSGVPYWGSDGTGFKCLTNFPHDKEMFLRWVEIMAASPIMMEDNACSNPIQGKQTKWTLWSDAETTETYARWARLHTRLAPYFWALAARAHATGAPITMHPFLLFPDAPEAWSIEDAYFLGPSLYAWPVVARGGVDKEGWLPPGRYVDLDDLRVYDGGADVTVPAPLDVLPIFLVENEMLPMLDPSIDTLAPATDPAVVTPERVADRLDVQVALGPSGRAHFAMADGTTLDAERLDADAGNPASLASVSAQEIPHCASCFVEDAPGDVARLRVNTALAAGSDVTVKDVHLVVTGGPARRVRWEVLRLRP